MGIAVSVSVPTLGVRRHHERLEGNARLDKLLDQLEKRHPALRQTLRAPDGKLHSHIGVYVNRQPVDHEGALGLELKEGDDVVFLPAVAGGEDEFTDERSPRNQVSARWHPRRSPSPSGVGSAARPAERRIS